MLVVLTLLTAAYFAAVVWVRRTSRPRPPAAEPVPLPVDDQPPASAVGWPPAGSDFSAYVAEGIEALADYLSEGFAT